LKTHKVFPETVYCVHEFEEQEYRAQGVDIKVMPDSIRGNIARVRNWLIEWAIMEGHRRILLTDDDLISLMAYWTTKRPVPLMGDVAAERIEHCFRVADEWGVALWGVNCVDDKGAYREYTPFSCKSYCSASFHGLDLQRLGALRYDERLPLKEDYDMCLQVLNRDRKLLRFNMLHMMKNDHANLGGCAMYRNIDKERQQMDLLIRKWGGRIVSRDLKSSELHDINPIVRPPIPGI